MMKHLEVAPLPPIDAGPDEDAWQERIADVLRELDGGRVRSAPRIILRGGTAARLGHGLTRPSRDIDADLTEPLDVWALLHAAAARAGLAALAEPRRGRGQKGQLTLTDPAIARAAIVEVDLRILRDPRTLATIGACTERRNGIWMYTAAELARQKIEMATESGRRRRAKDRYDIAWWLRNHVEHVAPEQRLALDTALERDPMLANAWDNDHRRDRIMRRIDSEAVHDALTTALERDPAVLQRRWPEGQLQIRVAMRGGADLTWRCRPQDETTLPIATFNHDRDLEQFMVRMRLWSPEEVPELLQELTLERQRARARSRTS